MAVSIPNLILLIFPLICGLVVEISANTENWVHLSQGELEGLSETSRDGKSFHSFKGIPYGKVEKRFAVSKLAEKWTGVLKAHDSGPGCFKSGFFSGGIVTGKEDCLTLDVYTPKLPSNTTSELLPTMVFIYGGAFVEGDSHTYGGSYFMDQQDVVLVVINYRLGAFGFLNAGVESASGNQGLKDQVLALQWVQKNIEYFSGDKDRVTIFGESAGSISASLHTLSPMSKGLFHRVIMQSGPANIPFVYHGVDGPTLAKKLARELDCPSSNMEYLVECFQRIDPKVFAPWMRFVDEIGFDGSAIWMGPSYETYGVGDNESQIFLSEDPYILAQQGKIHNKVPIIMGLIAFENFASAQAVTNSPKLAKKLNAQWGRIAPNMLLLTHSAEDPSQVTTAIKEHFMKGQDINSTTMMMYETLISERHWIHPFRIMASLYSKHVPVYAYNFTHQIPILKTVPNIDPNLAKYLPKSSKDGQTRKAPSHGDELPFLFDMHGDFGKFYEPTGKDSDDHDFSNGFVSTWTSFAKNGKPDDGPWGKWETYDKMKIMHIQNPPKLMPLPESWEDNTKFWNSLSIKENGKKWSDE